MGGTGNIEKSRNNVQGGISAMLAAHLCAEMRRLYLISFSKVDAVLQMAEHLCGPYLWKVYDLLVMPPKFPYGGMENPCITFIAATGLVSSCQF